jgi:hypothetical protein
MITSDAHAHQRFFVLTHVLAGDLALDDASAYLRFSTAMRTTAPRMRIGTIRSKAAALTGDGRADMGSH